MSKNNRGIGDNSDASDDRASLVDGLKSVINRIIAGVLEKDLYYDLAKDHHEEARTSTRVADRHESLQGLKECIEIREEPILILKKFYFSVRKLPSWVLLSHGLFTFNVLLRSMLLPLSYLK